MLFRVLGPVEVDEPEAVSHIGARKPRTLLAALLLEANAWVSVDELVAAIWADGHAPMSAERNVGTYIWQLRKLLPPLSTDGQRIESRSGAYRIRVEPGEVDADQFGSLLANGIEALDAGDPALAVRRLEAAASLWRGVPFEGLFTDAERPQIARLTELHWTVRERLADAYLAAARLPDAIALCTGLTSEDPLRETAWARLIVALRDAGRKADALAAYRRARETLVEELGIEPGAQLQRLHQELLSEDELDAATSTPLGSGSTEPDHGAAETRLPPADPPVSSSVGEPTPQYVAAALQAAAALTGHERSAALRWFDTERAGLADAIGRCVANDRVADAWQLCSAAHEYVEAGGQLDNWPQLLLRVATATRAGGERYGELVVRNSLGIAYTRDGRLPDACAEFTIALGIAAAADDRDAEGIVLVNLATAEAEFGASQDAVTHLRRALRLLEDPTAVTMARQCLAELQGLAGLQGAPGRQGLAGPNAPAAAS